MSGGVCLQDFRACGAGQSVSAVHKRMRHARRNGLIISAVLIIVAAACTLSALSPALDDTAKVRNAYLSQYSTTVTVGDAFDNFFGSSKWKAYEEGTQERKSIFRETARIPASRYRFALCLASTGIRSR